MKTHLALLSLVSLFLVATACSEKAGSAPEAKPQAAATTHAPEGAKPGSHEDWCGEHAVPESQCTQCHSDLIAAFKATGDWCEEHGLPESHCKKCNPELVIERPAKGS